MKIYFSLALVLLVGACGGEVKHSKSYYKDNDDARIKQRSWCADNPADAQSGNCINAEVAYVELYAALKEKRNADRQKIVDKLKEFNWIKRCVDVPDLNKCREDMKAGAAPINAELKAYNAHTRQMLDALR